MRATGILRSTKFTTRTMKNDDKMEDVNLAVLTIEVPIENLGEVGVQSLAIFQGQTVELEVEHTVRALLPKPWQKTMVEALK